MGLPIPNPRFHLVQRQLFSQPSSAPGRNYPHKDNKGTNLFCFPLPIGAVSNPQPDLKNIYNRALQPQATDPHYLLLPTTKDKTLVSCVISPLLFAPNETQRRKSSA